MFNRSASAAHPATEPTSDLRMVSKAARTAAGVATQVEATAPNIDQGGAHSTPAEHGDHDHGQPRPT
jgi:hypothetical protein